MGANQNARKLLFIDLVNTNQKCSSLAESRPLDLQITAYK